jgi:hypothetical protein
MYMNFGRILVQSGVVIHDKSMTNLHKSDAIHEMRNYLIFCGYSLRSRLSSRGGRRHSRKMTEFNPKETQSSIFLIVLRKSSGCNLDHSSKRQMAGAGDLLISRYCNRSWRTANHGDKVLLFIQCKICSINRRLC